MWKVYEKMIEFDFTKTEYLKICEEAMLSEEYCKLLEMKIKGYTRPKMALELNVSEPTLDIMIKKLKKKIRKIL
uniref:ECF sigma factor n=1 Tax=Siphoviridae sp. ctt8434 TaxID=2825703 RepID=A0A8S5U1H1_9CAUD|nr:MAG TPA: ECF sigma factor [Siphoviridae sp. ctt8434]